MRKYYCFKSPHLSCNPLIGTGWCRFSEADRRSAPALVSTDTAARLHDPRGLLTLSVMFLSRTGSTLRLITVFLFSSSLEVGLLVSLAPLRGSYFAPPSLFLSSHPSHHCARSLGNLGTSQWNGGMFATVPRPRGRVCPTSSLGNVSTAPARWIGLHSCLLLQCNRKATTHYQSSLVKIVQFCKRVERGEVQHLGFLSKFYHFDRI